MAPKLDVALPTLAGSSSRALGAYYTPSVAADLLVRWVLRSEGDRVLEPSIGDGAFLGALAAQDEFSPKVWGVELASDTYAAATERGLLDPSRAILGDFLATDPFPVDAVVGNPPYVRLRHLPVDQQQRAMAVARAVLGTPMDPAGSVWMAFVLHATRFLVRGGRLALVLPYDLTYVRYARPLWEFLGRRFGSLEVVRVHERMFPEILQEVVLLLADDFGGRTAEVEFRAHRSLRDLVQGVPEISAVIPVGEIVGGQRSFLTALLDGEMRHLLDERLRLATVPARELVTFNIGYVCGDKRFFHPSEEVLSEFSLPTSSLRPALTSSRQLRGAGIRTSSVPVAQVDRLFLPPLDHLEDGEHRYLAQGARDGVAGRYKCRVRDPWYVTPGVKVPDVVVPVFTERPAMLANDAGLVATNSLLCGYLRKGGVESLLAAWFTSLTLLQFELEIHALGGGVLVLVPREAGNLRLPVVRSMSSHVERLHRLLLGESVEDAFAAGDRPVLRKTLGLSERDCALIREAVETLAFWRTAVRSQK